MSLAKKGMIVLVAIVLFGAISVRPKAAHAISAFAWAGIGVASYAVLVITFTAIIFGGQSAPLTSEDGSQPLENRHEPGTLQFGTGCRSTGGNVAIACW